MNSSSSLVNVMSETVTSGDKEGAPDESGWTVTWVDVVEVVNGELIVSKVGVSKFGRPCDTPGCMLLDRHTDECTSLRMSGAQKRRLPGELEDPVEGSNEKQAVSDEASHRGFPAPRLRAALAAAGSSAPSRTCEHERQRSRCKDCGGSGICEHGRRRTQCKDCGGSGICEHGRQRSRCKDCGGSSVCEHGIRRDRCKDCGGSSDTRQ